MSMLRTAILGIAAAASFLIVSAPDAEARSRHHRHSYSSHRHHHGDYRGRSYRYGRRPVIINRYYGGGSYYGRPYYGRSYYGRDYGYRPYYARPGISITFGGRGYR